MNDSPPPGASMLALLDHLPPAVRQDVVRMYCAELREHLAQIERLGPALYGEGPQALGELARAAHKVAGAAGMMQDKPLADAACALHAFLKQRAPVTALTGMGARLRACAERSLAELERAIEG